MHFGKKIEHFAKWLLAVFAALLLWRPSRKKRHRQRLSSVAASKISLKILLVRLDNRVGEALLQTSLVDALVTNGHAVELILHEKTARVLNGHTRAQTVMGFSKANRFTQISVLRKKNYDVVVNCGNWSEMSVSHALFSRLFSANSILIGPAVELGRFLFDVAVAPKTDVVHEVEQRLHLIEALVSQPTKALSFMVHQIVERQAKPFVLINPGGRLDERRIPPWVFSWCARHCLQHNLEVIVTWGPGEESLAHNVVRAAVGAQVAAKTTIDELAVLMKQAAFVVCNNTGPMHLAVAVGAPTLALFFKMPMERWGHFYAPHHMVDLTNVEFTEAQLESTLRPHLLALESSVVSSADVL